MAVMISARLLESSDRRLDAVPDAQLVRLAQAGHAVAFAAIVRRYERELKAQAHRLTSDGRAEDALQQAFLNAFAALQAGHEVRHLRGWLHHILRNEVTRARVPLEAPLDPAAVSGEPLEDTVQLRATAHAALAALSALPERQRDALLSTAVLGLPRAHVARTMGLSEGAVRQLVHRARLRVRQAANALIPFPLVKLLGAARSGIDAAPDAALGAGTAASGGLAIKVGALLASGVVATGVAVTQTSPTRHRLPPAPHSAGQHAAHARAVIPGARASGPSVAPGHPASVINSVRRNEHGPAPTHANGRSHGGPGRLSGMRSGRHGDAASGPGRGDDAGRRDGGSARAQNGDSGRGHDDGSVSRSGSGAGSQSGSGADSLGSGSSGTGSGDGRTSGDGGLSSGSSGSGGGSVSSADGDASGGSASGSSAATTPSVTVTAATTSDGGGSSDGGTSGGDGSHDGSSGGGSSTETSGGSRDVSGSLDSSSS
jgi:RNA polymerase sigma factor (sigma-70 family)